MQESSVRRFVERVRFVRGALTIKNKRHFRLGYIIQLQIDIAIDRASKLHIYGKV